ncbi:hypothetical protein BCR43DRAFT_494824 [Syncephalastrum racemosum]|uniref:Uncharacterized protein n=1 Tax=Syncephalastrum racemosum TaxID=13706 RepID=A0A1X2H8P5_SYNRA|nr:hypothetical protein BCR43DRAFT_494824 [Syncephalastrum racemosum]
MRRGEFSWLSRLDCQICDFHFGPKEAVHTSNIIRYQQEEEFRSQPSAHCDQTSPGSDPSPMKKTTYTRQEEENGNGKYEESAFQPYLPGDPIPNKRKFIGKQVIALCLLMLIDVGIPLALYYGLRNVIDVLYALIIAGVPPFLWVVWGFLRKRRIDALGCIIGLSFILSGVVSIISGNARIALLRDGAVTAVVGVMFLVTLPPIKTRWFINRPLTYIMACQMYSELSGYRYIDKDGNQRQIKVMDWMWEHIPFFRYNMYVQTGAWGVLLVLEFVAVVLMVESTLSIDDIVKYNNIITSVVVAVMVTFSMACGVLNRRYEIKIGKVWAEEHDYTDQYMPQPQRHQRQETDANRHEQSVVV